MSTSRTNQKTLWIIALVFVAGIVLCCCLAIAVLAITRLGIEPWFGDVAARVEASDKLEETISVATPASLSVNIDVGEVIVSVGNEQEIQILVVKRAWGRDRERAEEYLDDLSVEIRELGNGRVRIDAKTSGELRRVLRTPQVDLDIRVPRDTDLDIKANVGQIQVTGVHGKFDIQANVDDLTLRDVQFTGDSRLKNSVGNIELFLATDSAFSFTAQTETGEIDIDFDVQNRKSERKMVGETLAGDIGTSPTAQVKLQNGVGNITIRHSD